MKKGSTLERQMLTYFGLIAAASLLITVEFTWAVRVAMFQVEALTQASSEPERTGNAVILALRALQNKAVLMFIVQAVVTLIVLVMLIRRITAPLQQMVEQSRLISEGDLSRTIPIRRRDEIGMLGETINGLTSNIQEIVAFGLSTDTSLKKPLEELRIRLSDDPESRTRLDEIEERLAGFRSILEAFKLLPAPLAESKADEK
jgi:methyl-accepting chemotaxis protein